MTREEAIRELRQDKELYETDNCHAGDGSPDGDLLEALNMAIEALQANEPPQSEQYKKGFEDAKRAFLIEYARESENMRKRNAQLEVMLNAQRAISADAVKVVRCKDCRHRIHDEERCLYYCEMYYGQGDVSDDNFCQWGAKMDGERSEE